MNTAKKIRSMVLTVILCFSMMIPSIGAHATVAAPTDTERNYAKAQLDLYYSDLLTEYNVDDATKAKLLVIRDRYIGYVNSASTPEYMNNYVSDGTAAMDKVIAKLPTTASDFLVVSDNVATPTANYGKQVTVILSILNLSNINITDVVVTPKTSATVSEWPFELNSTGYTEVINEIPGNDNYDAALANRREIQYSFNTRDDVLSGYYKLAFDVAYSRNGTIEKTTLYTYVNAVGAPGSGTTEGAADETEKSSKPRVIITGFQTIPEEVYAGDVFTVILNVQNTSQRTSVSNVQINLEATPEGTTGNTYEAFLPTSGSNTVYIDKIGIGGTANVEIEMTAKADLTQKPYSLEVKMEYEDEEYEAFTSDASVSIPILQESKFDTSTPDVMPASITVGSQSNVMFSIYNTGKTILYNVQVKFIGDSITGGDTFVGKIESSATGNVDAMITGLAPTMDDGTITAVISYEDAAGNVTTFDKTMNLYVTEEIVDMSGDMGGEIPIDGMDETATGSKDWIIYLVIGGVVAGIAAITIIVKERRKNKEKKELAKDLEGIDDIL